MMGISFGRLALVLVYLSAAMCQALWLMAVIILENVYLKPIDMTFNRPALMMPLVTCR